MKDLVNWEDVDSEDEYFYQYMCGINEFIKIVEYLHIIIQT